MDQEQRLYAEIRPVARNAAGIFVCAECGQDDFTQQVTANNAVTFYTNDQGEFVESDDVIGSWEVDDRGPLVCRRCGLVVGWPDDEENDDAKNRR